MTEIHLLLREGERGRDLDREDIKQDLARADTLISLGDRLVASQRDHIANFERNGMECVKAKELLAMFEELRLIHIGDRERLRRKLDAQD